MFGGIFWVAVGSSLFGGFVSWLVLLILDQSQEEKIKKFIDYGSLNLRSIMVDMMGIRRAQGETIQAVNHAWAKDMQDDNREYEACLRNKYDKLRSTEYENAKTELELIRIKLKETELELGAAKEAAIYQLPPPPEVLAENFCPEEWLFEMEKACHGKRADMRTFLPWFRAMIMAGYTNGKRIGFTYAKTQKKGKRK